MFYMKIMEVIMIKQTKIWTQPAPVCPRIKNENQSKTAMHKKPK